MGGGGGGAWWPEKPPEKRGSGFVLGVNCAQWGEEKVEGAKEKEKWTKYVEERELGLIWGVFTDVPLDLERESGILVRA